MGEEVGWYRGNEFIVSPPKHDVLGGCADGGERREKGKGKRSVTQPGEQAPYAWA
jgi:hypothetical protein